MRHVLSLVIVFALLGVARVGSTAPSDGDARRAAYRDGYAAVQAKKWDEAYAIFQRLWRESPTYDVALHLGHAEFNLGKNRDAAEHLAFGIAHLPPGEAKELAETGRRALERVKQEVGTITLIVDRSGATVRVDGQASGTTPIDFEIFVDPGTHVIEATLDGYQPATRNFQITGGEHQNVVLQLDPLPPAAPAAAATPSPVPTAEPRHSSTARTVALLSGVGVTVAAGVTTLVFALKASAAADRADHARASAGSAPDSACSAPPEVSPGTCTALHDAEHDRSSANKAANISLGITIAAAVTTTGLFFFWPRHKNASARNVRLLPIAGLGSGGLILSGEL